MSNDAPLFAAPTPQEAAAALDLATRSTATTAGIGHRWVQSLLLAWAAMTITVVLLVGLGGVPGIVLGSLIGPLFAGMVAIWAARQGVRARSLHGRYLLAVVLWAVLYGAALVLGLPGQAGNLAYWLPAALVTALPMLAAALWPRHEEQAA
ncbi:hypothetical protein ACFVQ3_08910 [Oerskovia sp. NPDC057915]|uniref:hypothetical protein n=1 Tax=Oerskovia sp. NPDC057915 TaxID=3346280 RepID=UPI0036D788CE